jgi:hypothetical protein
MSPWQLAKRVRVICNCLARQFMWYTNSPTWERLSVWCYIFEGLRIRGDEVSCLRVHDIRMTLPPHSARASAASFPLGSINPCSRSISFIVSPYCSLAEVPCNPAAFWPMTVSVCFRSNLNISLIRSTSKHVMIFVREAIYIFISELCSTSTLYTPLYTCRIE